MNRRDLLHLVGRRAERLTPDQSARAWRYLAGQLQGMGDLSSGYTPKFKDVVQAVRRATISGRQITLVNRMPLPQR